MENAEYVNLEIGPSYDDSGINYYVTVHNSKRNEIPIGCCVCGNGKKTLLNRNGKRICRDCYKKYLAELAIHG